MFIVYILKSVPFPTQTYIGFTHKTVEERLLLHSDGTTQSTARYRPWKIVWHCCFPDKEQALDFGKYLKSGSGRAFTAKRLLPRI
jgi:putative endonuclease